MQNPAGDTIKSRTADVAAAAAVNGVANPNEEPMDTSESTTQNPASTDQSVPNIEDDDDGLTVFKLKTAKETKKLHYLSSDDYKPEDQFSLILDNFKEWVSKSPPESRMSERQCVF